MKRIVVILAIIVAFSTFSVFASADSSAASNAANEISIGAEITPAQEGSTPEDTSTSFTTVNDEEGAPLTGIKESASEQAPDTQEDDTIQKTPEKTNIFATLYELILTYATEILSALAAIVSCLLAFGYKKGLLPFMQQGLSVISGTVNRLGEKAESANRTVCEQSEATRLMTEKIEDAVARMSRGILDVSERLCKLEEASEERRDIREALIGEIDMLGEIFLASSLPEYRKEKIGITVAKLKEQLSDKKGA